MAKRQFRILYREFLFRMVDLEILSAHALGDSSKLLGRFAALLVFISLGLSWAAFGFAEARMNAPMSLALTLVTEEFLISTTMLVVGIFAVLSWDSTFPNRRDVLVLAPLPVRPWTMFRAKVAAVATALCLTVVLFQGVSGLIWPMAFAMQARAQRAPAFTFDPTPAPVSAAGLQAVLDRDLIKLRTGTLAPGTGEGMAVGVYKQGVRRIFAYGAAKPDSLFEIGSLTKTFTALILARMVERGQVTLREPVRELLPPGLVHKPIGEEITLLDLATHHSGLQTMPPDYRSSDPAGSLAEFGIPQLYQYLSRHGVGKLAETPFAYSNLAVGLLGHVLALRSGKTYAELLRDEVTGPLGLRDTVVELSPDQQARFLQGQNGQHQPMPAFHLDALAGAGAIRATAGDLLTYLEDNLHPQRAGALASAIRETHRLRAEAGDFQIGLIWLYMAQTGTYSHNGRTMGASTYAFFNSQGDYAAVILVNQGSFLGNTLDLIDDHVRARLAGQPAVSLDTVFVPASNGLLGTLRWFGAYWFTMLAAGTFLYCCVLGAQGLAAQLLPRRLFLRVSGFMQLGAFCLFVLVYFLQPRFASGVLLEPVTRRLFYWLPPFWFLGLMQQLNGSPLPALQPLAHRAWIGLAVVSSATAVAYALSYLRTLRQIVEEPDIAPGARRMGWLPGFVFWGGDRQQTAVGQFAVRTLARSRQHRLILAFYLGIGLALTIFLLQAPAMRPDYPDTANAWHGANTPLLAASIMMMALAILGARVVFAMPLELRANWIFRVAGVRGGPMTLAATRRSLAMLSALPIWLGTAALCLRLWPWRQAAGHLALLGLVAMILIELCLHGFDKIPFACSYLPGKSQVHLVFLGALGLLWFVTLSVKLERQMLLDVPSTVAMVAPFAVLAIGVRIWSRMAASDADELRFEEEGTPAVQELGLHRDGVMPVE